jgi:ABC-type transport system involved in cytochrome c biogenesis permease subunit
MGVTHLCFGLSYLTALVLELVQAARPARWAKITGLAAGIAGLVAHTIFLLIQKPSPATPYGSLVLLAWVFAVFYLIGSMHRNRRGWGVFVLPVVLLLVVLSFAFVQGRANGTPAEGEAWYSGTRFWGIVHGSLILAASVGITVAFLASVMYLLQARRLRRKLNPIGGMKLLSLERLERMNRRGIDIAFPLLTAGILLGLMRAERFNIADWAAPKVIGTVGLWVVGVLLLYLRYGVHLAGRRLAFLTIGAFCLLLLTLAAAHPFAQGDAR